MPSGSAKWQVFFPLQSCASGVLQVICLKHIQKHLGNPYHALKWAWQIIRPYQTHNYLQRSAIRSKLSLSLIVLHHLGGAGIGCRYLFSHYRSIEGMQIHNFALFAGPAIVSTESKSTFRLYCYLVCSAAKTLQ